MALGFYDLKNGIGYDDYGKISKFERSNRGIIFIDEVPFDFYIIRLVYKDGTCRDIRAYCESGTSDKLVDEKEKELFFIKRLFGKDGLIVKEQRNDYIYLGGINNEKGNESRYSRFNKSSNGKTMQQIIDDKVYKEILPKLSFKNMNEEFDLLNMEYYFHTGNEDIKEVFQNGIRSRFGRNGHNGFCSLTSTFYRVDGEMCEYNNLCDCVRSYGAATSSSYGKHVFIIKIPSMYRGQMAKDGTMYPPLPTHKMINYESGDCIIIPEIIYGVYDIGSNTLYKNPKYNPKYNPNGLVYDQETADKVEYSNQQLYSFMNKRKAIPFDQLKMMDEREGTFDQVCSYYGIKKNNLNSFSNLISSFRRR